MNPISLDDLPRYSPWPETMLSPNGHETKRTWNSVRKEYGNKYRVLLRAWQTAEEPMDFQAVRELELPEREVAMSRGNQLFATSLRDAMEESVQALVKAVRGEAMLAGSAVDLGCGYGYALYCLRQKAKDVKLYGGELALPGVTLARNLDRSLGVEEFDFLSGPCGPLEKVESPSVVFTSYALHQLYSAEPFVELLSRCREKVEVVINLEPDERHFGNNLLGLLRRRYGQVNGYSADIGRVLAARDDVKVEYVEPNVIGANALLPATLTAWRFK